ncbi:unnamed protein product, partial [Dovyalis caffra]
RAYRYHLNLGARQRYFVSLYFMKGPMNIRVIRYNQYIANRVPSTVRNIHPHE